MGKKNIKYDIVMFADGLPFEWDQFESKSLGGSEGCALASAKMLAKRGHHITLFCRCEKVGKQPDGVIYRPIGSQPGQYDIFQQYIITVPHDILIIQRIPEMLHTRTNSKINIVWMHDLGWNNYAGKVRSVTWNIDEIWALTEFHKEQMKSVYSGPDGMYHVQNSGAIIEHFDRPEFQNIEKEPNRLFYSARPERGMDVLLFEIMPRLIEKIPDVKLYIAGYDLIPADPGLRTFYEECFQQAQKLRDNVIHLGALTKEELYREMVKSQAYIYPTNFEETFCLTAIECQRAGTPFITTDNIGALPETLHRRANIFVKAAPNNKKDPLNIFTKHDQYVRTEAFYNKFTQSVIDFLNFPKHKKSKMREVGINFAKKFTWEKAISQWEDHFKELFEKRTNDKKKLAVHLYKNNDIIAAETLARENNDAEMGKYIFKNYNWLFSNSSLTEHYNNYDFNPEALKRSSKACESIPRIQEIVRTIAMNPTIKNILDYGCGEGVLSYPIANTAKNRQIYGVDIAESKIKIANEVRTDRSKYNNIQFSTISIDVDVFIEEHKKLRGKDFKYDALVMSEVMEHIENPQYVIDKLETLVKPGGIILITTPHGPFESFTDPYHSKERRSHLHNFDRHDLSEMFNLKKDVDIKFIAAEVNKNDPSMILSHAITTYIVNGRPCCDINYMRKFLLQAPQEMLSTCIIAKNNEETILSCLNSIEAISDEIIVLDTGSTDGTMDIVKRFSKARVIKGSNPLQIPDTVTPDDMDEGFCKSRNESIREAKYDWILWIDTDEKLTSAENIYKYLRFNHFNGYAIRQNHFTCQPPNAFPPDLPTRLFRNNRGIKFYGVVHEHPEIKLNDGIGFCVGLHDIDISHPAYLTETIRKSRFIRNFPLVKRDREKFPKRVLGQFMWVRDLIHWSRYNLTASKNRMTPEVYGFCQEVIVIVRDNFLNGNENLHISDEIMKYYSEACVILNIGFDVNILMDVAHRNPSSSKVKRIRFATIEDYRVYTSTLIEATTKRFEGKYNTF